MIITKNMSEFFSYTSNLNPDILQLLLFVDNRHGSQKNIEQIKEYLNGLSQDYNFHLQVLEISEYPHLVEHFKLVVTPALVKVNPPPQQTLAGTNLTAKLKKILVQMANIFKRKSGCFS